MARWILVDGPAASGKGTLAKKLSEHFKFEHLDSGTFYRAVAARMIVTGENPLEIARTLTGTDFKRDLRSVKVDELVPAVSCLPEIRIAVNDRIRETVAIWPGIVMDGRAGALEFPEADVKIFLTAPLLVRATRRWSQFHLEGNKVGFEDVLRGMMLRDQKDVERTVAPLVKPTDSEEIDSTYLSQAEVLERAIAICMKKLGATK